MPSPTPLRLPYCYGAWREAAAAVGMAPPAASLSAAAAYVEAAGTGAAALKPGSPDPRLERLYSELELSGSGHQLSSGDSCWSPRVALLGAWTAVIAAGAGTAALVLAPEPTTLTKWAAIATAAALVGALVGLVAAYGAVADCVQAADDAAERQREIDDLRKQQQAIQKTVDELKRAIGSK